MPFVLFSSAKLKVCILINCAINEIFNDKQTVFSKDHCNEEHTVHIIKYKIAKFDSKTTLHKH